MGTIVAALIEGGSCVVERLSACRAEASTDRSASGEWVLEQGDTLAVMGTAMWESAPEGTSQVELGYRDNAKRLRVIAPQGGQVLLTVRPDRFGE
jgi:hypothetical protein